LKENKEMLRNEHENTSMATQNQFVIKKGND